MAIRMQRHLRAIKALLCFIGVLALFAVLMATEIWWLDVVYLGIAFTFLLVLSVRVLFGKWRLSNEHDVTKHGPMAAYPVRWRRWLTDDYPEERQAEADIAENDRDEQRKFIRL